MTELIAEDQKTPPGEEFRSWKYRIQQVAGGARITVHADDADQVVRDYDIIRNRLKELGYVIAPEE